APRFPLLIPTKPRGSYRLRLSPVLRGEVSIGGQKRAVADVLTTGAPSARDAAIREIEFGPGDKARLTFADVPDLRIEFRFVETPPLLPRPRLSDSSPFFTRTVGMTSIVLGLFVAAALIFAPEDEPRRLVLTAERVAKIMPPAPPPPPVAASKKKDEEKTKEESGQMKKAKDDQGKLGKHDALAKDTVIPKGEKDILRDKVSKVGLLGLIGKERPQGSGLAKLFAEERDVEQAIAGMHGATMVAGRGSGGLSTTGTAAGGGGTGMGHLYGAGDVDTGGRAARGRGRGPTLASRKEHEVKLDVAAGSVDEGGGLSREQVARVVRAHLNAIKFCYDKELQRKPTLGGKVEVFWVITPDGSVERSKIAGTSMDDGAVEGCIVRQVKQWAFPRSDGRTVVQSFPFVFRGGV
ncbi:MAG: AgmX/PglI C-terminal domain-containing protein, partial [Bacteroidota bacterium]